MKYSLLSVLSKWADSQFGFLDKFRFSPKGLSNKNSLKRYLFCQNGLIPKLDLVKFRFNPNFELSVQMAYPMRILEGDKVIEVRSKIIRTRLGC